MMLSESVIFKGRGGGANLCMEMKCSALEVVPDFDDRRKKKEWNFAAVAVNMMLKIWSWSIYFVNYHDVRIAAAQNLCLHFWFFFQAIIILKHQNIIF